jgi:Tol biopolymer transport system component
VVDLPDRLQAALQGRYTIEIARRYPTWSPDARRIAFSSSADPDWIPYSIYAMNADGSGITLVNPPLAGIVRGSLYPAWSPQ